MLAPSQDRHSLPANRERYALQTIAINLHVCAACDRRAHLSLTWCFPTLAELRLAGLPLAEAQLGRALAASPPKASTGLLMRRTLA